MSPVYLAQTDTTVGLLSQDASRLATIKEREPSKPFIQSFDTLKRFTKMGGRVPNTHKNRLRRAVQTTFVIKGSAIRIVSEGPHHKLLKKYGWFYTTSANARGKGFDRAFGETHADIIVEDARGLFEGSASTIYKINHLNIKQLR